MLSYIQHGLTHFAVAILVALACGCEVEQTKEAEMPEVEVKGGQMPQYEVKTPDVDVKMEKKEIEVPDVDVAVETEKKEIEVPDVDIAMPDEEETDTSDERR
jgi:hypothetical protein